MKNIEEENFIFSGVSWAAVGKNEGNYIFIIMLE